MGPGTWKLHLGHVDLKNASSYKFTTLATIFLSRDLFYPESEVESN